MNAGPHLTPEREDRPEPPSAISDEQRSAALRAGRTPVPPRFILLVAAVFVVLGLGGVILERVIGIPGAQPVAPTSIGAPSTLPISSTAILGLRRIAHANASPIALTDQHGSPWSLADQWGHVVILAFYNQSCNDICPVLGAELRTALSMLGTHSDNVEIAIVNTDPTNDTTVAQPPALTRPGLSNRANVVFLTGSLQQLNDVWSHYGVEVRVGRAPAPVIHNDVLYFITARGAMAALATPFANENHRGVVSLDAASQRAFAAGVAEVASSLLP